MVKKTLALVAAVLIAHSQTAGAAKSDRIEAAGCQGNWQAYSYSYSFSDGDRRNYYYVQRDSAGGYFLKWANVFGPYEADSRCLPVGVGFGDTFRTVACTNDDYDGGSEVFGQLSGCDLPNSTSGKRVPRRSCAATP